MPYRIRLKTPAGRLESPAGRLNSQPDRLHSQPDRLVLDNSSLPDTPPAEWQPLRAPNHSARRLAPLAFPGQVLLGLAEQPAHHAPARRPGHPAAAPTTASTAAAALQNASTPPYVLRELANTARRLGNLLTGGKGLRILHGAHRRLQVTETVQLGEKRFVAILRVDGEQFLIGGSATGVSLLSNLQPVQPARLAFAPEAPTAPQPAPDPAPAPALATFEAILAAHHSAEGAA